MYISATASNVKLKVTLNVVPQATCDRLYEPFSIRLTSSHLCAGGDIGYDSCKGKRNFAEHPELILD